MSVEQSQGSKLEILPSRSQEQEIKNPLLDTPVREVPVKSAEDECHTEVLSRNNSMDTNIETVNKSAIRVCVRVRPLHVDEDKIGSASVLTCLDANTIELESNNGEFTKQYSFDFCSDCFCTQPDFFLKSGLINILESAVNGYACTVLAYGATGSGKTFTMSGTDQIADSNVNKEDDEGLIPRSMRYIFDHVKNSSLNRIFSFKASYYEIYNEQVYDLLNLGKAPLAVRHNPRKGFFVQGLFIAQAENLEDVLLVVDEGNNNRRVASHELNKDSSRSHSIFTLYIQSKSVDNKNENKAKNLGKIAFVDLAGSERLKKTQVSNERETGSINRSLMTLGKVINALSHTTSNSNTAWVPYRDSALTKLLMDSLGGKGLTLMVACVSPSATQLDETVSTLNYAARTRYIFNKPIKQPYNEEHVLSLLRKEVYELKQENAELHKAYRLKNDKMFIPVLTTSGITSHKIFPRLAPLKPHTPKLSARLHYDKSKLVRSLSPPRKLRPIFKEEEVPNRESYNELILRHEEECSKLIEQVKEAKLQQNRAEQLYAELLAEIAVKPGQPNSNVNDASSKTQSTSIKTISQGGSLKKDRQLDGLKNESTTAATQKM